MSEALTAGVAKTALGATPWGAIGNVASSLIGAVGSAYAAKKAYKYQSKLMEKQYGLTRSLNQNAYQDTTFSMRQSGINPMLAITNGVNGLSAGSGGSVNVQNPVEAGINTAYSRSAIKNERMLAESNSNSANATASNLKANEDYTRDQNEQFNKWNPEIQKAYVDKIKADISNVVANTADTYNQMMNRDRMTASNIDLNSASAKRHQIESELVGKKLGWYDIENYAKALGMTATAFISSYGLKQIAGGRFIKPAQNLVKVAPKIIKASTLGF